VSSTSALAKIVHDAPALQASVDAIRALDRRASGVYFVDLKEDARGQVRITEVNAGRFANVPTIHDASGADNMVHAYLRAALGEPAENRNGRVDEEDCYVLRSLDMPPVVLRGGQIFENVEDLR
jgi:hypothetical protein